MQRWFSRPNWDINLRGRLKTINSETASVHHAPTNQILYSDLTLQSGSRRRAPLTYDNP